MKIENYKLKIILLVAIMFLPFSALALEVSFPTVQGVGVTDSMGPAEWIHYIFLFAQAMVGLAIIYAFVRAGLIWMVAGDNSGKIKEAREWIYGAVIGLVILLGSYLFLNTINPQLVNIKNPGVNFGTDAPSDMVDFWVKLFTSKRSAGESCGSNSDCLGTLECIKDNPKLSSGVCADTNGLFLGYGVGHTCEKDLDCGKNLTCDSKNKVCIYGTKSSGGSTCGPGTACPNGLRCFKTSSGELADNVPGECSSYKAIGEECRTDIADECRGTGVKCKMTDAANHKGVCTKE